MALVCLFVHVSNHWYSLLGGNMPHKTKIPTRHAAKIFGLIRKGVTAAEIAKIYGCTRGTARSCLLRIGLDYSRIAARRRATRRKARAEYRVYWAMLSRCYNSEHPNYPNWGGRGVHVVSCWRGKHGFERFLADVGPRPKGRTKQGRSLWSIHRKDGAMVYSPKTVKWATMKEQASNGRRNHWAQKRAIKAASK